MQDCCVGGRPNRRSYIPRKVIDVLSLDLLQPASFLLFLRGMIGFGSRMTKRKKTGTVPVYLNVYDLTPINGYAYWLGLGVYHSGVQVHGVEYAYGAHDRSTGGIFEVEPKHCPGFTFRKSITIGKTNLGPKEVRSLMEKLAERYTGNTYHLITKNCNHFCNDVCLRLAGKSIPSWVNRLARLGFLCNCVLPASINKTKVQQGRLQRALQGEMENFPGDPTRFESSSVPPPPRLSSSSRFDTHSSRHKHCKTPSSSMQTPSNSFTLRL